MTDSPVMSVEALRSVPLFASVGDEDALALVGLLKPRSLPRGALLFRQGDAGDAMYLVESGSVRIFVTDEDGEELTLADLARGDFFGETASAARRARAPSRTRASARSRARTSSPSSARTPTWRSRW
jgi:CRP-like cAMP-binding protein